MKRFFTVLAAGLLIAALSVPALAWEFDLKGDFIWKYDYITQGGKAGFFGPFDVANVGIQPGAGGGGTAPNWAAMNAWVGARNLQGGQLGTQFGLVTGEDASFNYQRMEFYPEIRVNPAVRLRGTYQIGGLKPAAAPYLVNTAVAPTNSAVGIIPPFEYSVYQNSSQFGAWDPIDTGSWTQWWGTAQTPWGIVVFGKRGLGFGTGVQYVESSASSESLAVVAPYGPLRIGLGGYLHRRQTWVNALVGGTAPTTLATSPAANISFFDGGTFTKQWDHDSERHGQPFVFVTYQSGDLDTGFIYEWFMEHDGPQARASQTGQFNTVTRDETLEDGSAYVKYNNGRFFLNSEVAWVRGQVHYQLPQNAIGASATFNTPGAAGGGNALAPASTEAWKFGTELGVLCGPAKTTLFFSWVPGPDRRAGIWTNNQTWENVINGTFLGNSQYFKPYSMLLAYQYGAGLNALDRNGEGYMTDAITYAARLDYAVAANLNVYGTFMYANRQSHGWGWGCLTPTVGANVALLGRATGAGTYIPAINNAFDPTGAGLAAPNIPDDALGWEVDTGVDWKLLEGFQLNVRGAYWEPGNWFKFACVDKTLATTTVNFGTEAAPLLAINPVIGAGTFAVNPNKSIDAIWGLQGTLLVDF